MIREITIGQYYPVDSLLHRLDPRVKLIGTILYAVSLFFAKGWIGYAVTTIALLLVWALSKIPLSYIVRGMKPMVILLMITVLFGLFMTPGQALVRIWKLKITQEGVQTAFMTACRLIFLVMGTSMMTYTTTSNDLTDAMERVMAPLRKIRVPVHELAMIMSIALRFIPILIEETNKIMKAQMARGADFEHGNLLQKAKNMIPLLVPLIVSAFRRAEDLAEAMEARCYRGGEYRTKMKPLKYEKRDCVAYVAVFGYLLLIFTQYTH